MPDYRSLTAWRVADEVAADSFRLGARVWSPGNSPAIDQLRRAALSVPLNIAEGHAYGPGARCRYHFRVAYASAVETLAVLDFLEKLGTRVGKLADRARDSRALTYKLWATSKRR
jgi:four helix bundle protein